MTGDAFRLVPRICGIVILYPIVLINFPADNTAVLFDGKLILQVLSIALRQRIDVAFELTAWLMQFFLQTPQILTDLTDAWPDA